MAVAAMGAVCAVAGADSSELASFETVYTVRISFVRGESRISLRKDSDGTYIYDAHTRPTGLIGFFVRKDIRETSRFRIDGDRLVPLHYERTDTISDEQRDMVLDFDWDSGVATIRYDDTEEQIELTPDAIDPGLLAIAVKFDLANSRPPGPYAMIERGKVESISVQPEGEESLDTRAGSFNTERFSHESPDQNRTTKIWSAESLGYLMVQMAQYKGDRERAKLTLESLEFGD